MNKKILVVDDDVDILEIVSMVLEEKGYSIVKSLTSDVLDELGVINPDLIILDNTIGACSGSELCKELKANDSQKHIPVILCSAVDDLDMISKSCKANTFLAKPFNLNELDKVVASMI